ncbi:MAG: c-type cytochrome [Xanthomonadales bacterium]|nr:c-type cytochrome [Xanthomonadales bacterium]MDH3923960.1 c-type cytochrome [Xanthomonadales bacterium]MDH3940570.1 c-type cytochrome [Xanthomonadales bacterium]MDH4002139.1 c-type cytochrome [Xanthomonadales bacterium]
MKTMRVFFKIAVLAVLMAACSSEDTDAPARGSQPKTFDERMISGKKLYASHCAACHQANGQGLTGAFPPLAQSSYLLDGPGGTINVILNGLSGPVTVNGMDYNAIMPNLSYLDDGEIAEIVTFVMNSWNNPGGEVSAAEVAAARAGGGD